MNKCKPLHYRERMLFLMIFISLNTVSIYRCTTPDGHSIFTDRGCPNGKQVTPLLAPNRADPPTNAEQQRSNQLELQLKAHRAQRNRAREQLAQERSERIKARQDACAQAMDALKQLRALRRKGYSLKDHKALAQQEHKHRSSKRANC